MPGDKATGMSRIFTVGHSTLSLDDFINLMKKNLISEVADVRTVPRSRHNPQFNKDALKTALGKENIAYSHYSGLGGLRKPLAASANKAWKNASFRGFADYMQTRDFTKNLEGLIKTAKRKRIAIMCAEAVPWRCHRSLISDALTACDFDVEHIMNMRKNLKHTLTPWSSIKGKKILYPLKAKSRSLQK